VFHARSCERRKKNNERDSKLNTLVLEQTEYGEMPVDVYQKLANDRILFITDDINDQIATDIIATLLLKDSEDPDKKITIFINSSGGDIRNAFMIYDVMNMISAPIETVCIGSALDEAAILLASGQKGMRLATKNAVIAISQLVHDWYMHTNLTDAKNLLEQSQIDNNRLMEIFSKATGKSSKEVKEDFDRRVFFSAAQAVKYGLIDKVVTSNK
jgi:ATP-dependent Clp protease protease subunit